MTERIAIVDSSVPKLPRHIKLRFDETRQQWLMLAPERVLMPDEIAVAILRRCDGVAARCGGEMILHPPSTSSRRG